GNITQKRTQIEDDYGVYVTLEEASFSDATDAWPNRYAYRKVTQKAVNRSGKLGISSVSTDSDKIVQTDVTWNTAYRKPSSISVKQDGTTVITTTATKYNSYGLPTEVTVTGDVIQGQNDTRAGQIRKTTTNYSNNGTSAAADGYFPYQITQYATASHTHITTTRTQAKTGLPTQVTDVAGVVTSTSYDALARPISIARTGFPEQLVRYYGVNGDSHAPSNAIMRVETRQAGAPDSREYKDLLGRTLRSATQGFDGTWIYQDSRYNKRGLMTHETHPYYANQTPRATVYGSFDVLGRAQSKTTPQINGQLQATYFYDGLKTEISVAATLSDTGDLSVSRTYNALEQLVRTEDAIGGVTQYAYDGAGNPIVIRDAKNNDIVARYDSLGRKQYVIDPNQGRTDFTYNDFGELEKEVDANNKAIRYDMDLLGRVTSRIADGPSSSKTIASFNWDTQKDGLLGSQSQGGSS
ncbi:hypothetical protein HJG39_19175, partial [Alteromonas sp. a30]